jgi:hypothetical protein
VSLRFQKLGLSKLRSIKKSLIGQKKFNYFVLVNLLLASGYFIFFLSGFWNNKSSVPYWDEWDSRVNLWTNFNTNGVSALFSLHNEHRPILTYIVFTIDSWFFSGSGSFVYVTNIVSIFLIGFLFYSIFKHATQSLTREVRIQMILISFLPFVSLTGKENIFWVNQNSFFFSILFSLLPFACLVNLRDKCKKPSNALLVLFLGLMATLTMASGILVPFFIGMVYLLVYRNILYFVCNSALGILVYIIYTDGISKISGSDPFGAILTQPIIVVQYAFKFLTGPFYSGTASYEFVGYLVGVVEIFILIKLTYSIVRKGDSYSRTMLILAYYFVLIAVLIGAGRVQFGLEQALSSRYTIFAWSFLILMIILSSRQLDMSGRNLKQRVNFQNLVILIIILGTSTQQLSYSNNNLEIDTRRLFAQQLLKFGLGDSLTQVAIYPDYSRLLEVSEKYKDTEMFNFSSPLFSRKFNEKSDYQKVAACTSYLETARFVDSNSEFMVVSGWIGDPLSKSNRPSPLKLSIFNRNDVNVGVGFVGIERADASRALGVKESNFGYLALISSDHLEDELYLETESCKSKVISIR